MGSGGGGSPAAGRAPTSARSANLAPDSLAASVASMDSVFDVDKAMALLRAIDPYYRVRGNSGYLRSIERIVTELKAGGYGDAGTEGVRDTLEVKEFGDLQPAWTPVHAKLEVFSPEPVAVLQSFDDESGAQRTFLCTASFSTPADGLVAPLVRYDQSRPAEGYAGSVVYGTEPADLIFAKAVQQGGALGVISSYLPAYNRGAVNRDAVRFSHLPYDADHHGFGMNVSPANAERLETLLAGGLVYVRVTVQARFTEARSRTVVARIGGTLPGAGTIALVGHLDEPGANDNGSGVAALSAMATGYLRAIQDGRVPRPRRSITFLIGTEYECSREWLRSRPEAVDLALVLDMVGENQAATGATALVERMPDPGAIWDRPPLDQHSQWGRSDDVRESDLKGSFLNDYVMAAMAARAADGGWTWRTNPFEGGSDHESFLARGIPAVLLWHFTDQYYHTSLDRLDTVDPQEMRRTATAALGLVNHFANAGLPRAQEVLALVLAAARTRLGTEADNAHRYLSAPAVANDAVQISNVSRRERAIIVAWSRWYREALLSLEAFDPDPSAGPDRIALVGSLDSALTEIRDLEQQILDTL
ncbi:MAG TPA: M28 family peptidase [Planctomycetota bacterium]|nr:M28 family peptidase [Planctomycetota bacterium]